MLDMFWFSHEPFLMPMNGFLSGMWWILSRWNILPFWILRIYLSQFEPFSLFLLMLSSENLDNLSPEEILTPPRYDGLGVTMSIMSAFIVSIVSGVIILTFSYFLIGNLSLEVGVSPLLLAMITFFWLIIGNIIYIVLLSKIFPNIYTRGRTTLAQIAIMSIILYVFFAPVYLIISNLWLDSSTILIIFALHVILNAFCFQLIIGLTTQYRYILLTLYSGIASFLVTIIVVALAYVSFSVSSNALFLLLGLVIVVQTLGAMISGVIFWAYYRMYTVTGADPIGSIFARIEQEEKESERQATETLTHFHQ